MKPNQNIFCNTPWYQLHIYWDGGFGLCCQEHHRVYTQEDQQYNISRMGLYEWFNSEPAREFRSRILEHKKLSACTRCYMEEEHHGNSRRLKSNQKSVIFTRSAFDQSFQQSPGYKHFLHSYENNGYAKTHPIDLHIDLGNFCNLACKMCNAQASSTIASQEVRWGIESSRQYLGSDWTRNRSVWNRFKQELLEIPGLNNIHFMGGETLLTDRLEDLVDTMISAKRYELCFSFTTNGTVVNTGLLDKLKLFKRVGIEISIETLDDRNAYQRQGTDTQQVIKNIDTYLEWCNGSSITVALRPVPSLLTIGSYSQLLEFALIRNMIVKSAFCYDPRFLSVEILPDNIKQLYKPSFEKLLQRLPADSVNTDYNASNPNNHAYLIKEDALLCLSLLESPAPDDMTQQLQAMVRHCERWDRVYRYDARKLYPEFAEIFDTYDYSTSS